MSKPKGAVVTKVAITEDGFIVSAELPPLHTRQLEIIADGRTLHILCGPGRQERFESLVEVPPGYRIDDARAIYLLGNLRIVVPREKLGKSRRR